MLPACPPAGKPRYVNVKLQGQTNQPWVEAGIEAKHCLQMISDDLFNHLSA